ncbi:MAG TPA: ATP-dependent 6-phosphofructokinase [Pyrinomonadaceae bacterium]|jgi:6-phosphofructokinase 1|nr:ATP-dependent 6-phosphofructokinase [Pyrinomonadaceae bacterium]
MGVRIGILTSGGDCPGLNAVLRAVVRRAMSDDSQILGIKNGWRGLIDGDIALLTRESVRGILPRGGTILGTSRVNPEDDAGNLQRIHDMWKKFELNALIVVGGEGTMRAARDMWRDFQYPVVGIPKTIDNDLCGTDFTFGFDTAVSVVTDAVDRLHSTAESHHRVMVVEVMGRHSGWIAAYGGIAGGADVVLVPEHPFRLSRVCERLRHREQEGNAFSIIVVAEDAKPHPEEDFLSAETRAQIYRHHRLGGIGFFLAAEIEKITGIDARVTTLGYVQRGGSPTAFDRVLATRFGVKGYEMVMSHEWGRMASLRGNQILSVPLDEAVDNVRPLEEDIYRVAEIFFG